MATRKESIPDLKLLYFVLYILGYTNDEARDMVRKVYPMHETPNQITLNRWNREGALFKSGKDFSWKNVRKVYLKFKRLQVDYVERVKKARAYESWVNDTKADLETVQEAMMKVIVNVGIQNPKASDLKAVIQSRQLIEGKATERIEYTDQTLFVMGMIIHECIKKTNDHYRSKIARDQMDFFSLSFSEEIERYIKGGADPAKFLPETAIVIE